MKDILKNSKGMSLVEIMIAGLLLGMIGLISTHILKRGKQVENKSNSYLNKHIEFQTMQKYLNPGTIDWRGFLPNESVYKDPSGLNNKFPHVSWILGSDGVPLNQEDIAINLKFTTEKFYRTSYSLDHRIIGSDDLNLVFTRCVEKTDKLDKSYKEYYKSKMVPKVIKKGSTNLIYCCNVSQTTCVDNQVKNENSSYQIKTFVVGHDERVTIFPSLNEEVVMSAGFMLEFDKPKRPNSYVITSFVQVDKCKLNGIESNRKNTTKCNQNYSTEIFKQSGSVLGVQDRGYIQIR